MYLKSLTLKGFKSFASSTTLKLEPGICAVVGPNGSGKSNVVDALAWVMGEQGAKTLRGGSMDDVIFAGAGQRAALGRAEVTLTIDNSDNVLPIDFTEVSITRRVYRDGGSEYEINGAKARLMDIQELLSDSGIGREMHVIVGQGRLASILESKPEDRRAYIEEAAGVLKHRRRKDKAERKLVSMQANLDRLQDLTGELERQLKPLARQAEAAKRAATVQADVREARINLAADHINTVRTEHLQAAEHAQRSMETAETIAEQFEELEQQRNELEGLLTQVRPQSENAQKTWFSLSSLVERISATQRIANDRADSVESTAAYHGQDPEELEAKALAAAEQEEELISVAEEAAEKLETIREQVAESEQIAADAEKEHLAALRAIADRREGVTRLEAAEDAAHQRFEAAQADVDRASEAIAALEPVVQEATNALAQAQTALEEHAQAADQVQEDVIEADRLLAAAEARVKELRAQERDHERAVSALQAKIDTLESTIRPTDGQEWVRTHTDLVTGRLADVVSVAPGWDVAVGAALGAASEALTIKPGQQPALEELINNLTDAQAGRAVLARESDRKTWRLTADLPNGAEWLLDKLTITHGQEFSLTSLLVDVVAVPTLSMGIDLVEQDQRLRAVTQDGTLIGPGWVAAGTGATTPVEVKATILEAQQELERAQAAVEELSGAIAGAETAANEAREKAARAHAAQSEYTAVHNRLDDRVRNAGQALTRSEQEMQRATTDRSRAEARVDNIREELAELALRRARLDQEEDLTEDSISTAERDEAHRRLTQIRAMEVEARMSLRVAQERASSIKGKADSLRRQAEQERQARARFEQAQTRRRNQRARAVHVASWCATLLQRTGILVEQATAQRDDLHARVSQLQSELSRVRDRLSAVQQQLHRAQTQAHEAEVKKEAAAVRVEQVEKNVLEQLGIAPDDLIAQTDLTDFDRTAEQKRLQDAEKALKSLGKVNPLALEEYKALEERYSFLSTQLMDVKKAREDLKSVIRDVDDTILQLFTDAWKDVQAQFPHVFSTLFPGGEGRLTLTDPDDMLTTGIEVHARPPGKKVTRLSLLSGGEKSLTALALLVSIFRARPSPFYVMDEVEAALDDVNLRRLIALFEQLRADSQLIVITHQKPTMDIANVLYGVTMRGDGVTRVISQRMSPKSMEPTESTLPSLPTP